jgi:hypothetical protein
MLMHQSMNASTNNIRATHQTDVLFLFVLAGCLTSITSIELIPKKRQILNGKVNN